MVDALEAVRSALRPRGLVFDLQPDAAYRPLVAIRGRGRRERVGEIARPLDEDVVAANAARDRLVHAGRFEEVAFLRRTFATRHTSIASLRARLRSHTPPWRLAPGSRARLRAIWRARREGDVIETTARMTLAVLRVPATATRS